MRFNSKQEFLTVKDVSDLLKLSIITIYKYIRERKLDAIEFGGHYRIHIASLNKFIEDHKVRKQSIIDSKIRSR